VLNLTCTKNFLNEVTAYRCITVVHDTLSLFFVTCALAMLLAKLVLFLMAYVHLCVCACVKTSDVMKLDKI